MPQDNINIKNCLNIINQIVTIHQRKILSTAETKILDLVFQDKTYDEIAETLNYDSSYVGEVARNVFKIVSLYSGILITKCNVIAVFNLYGEKILKNNTLNNAVPDNEPSTIFSLSKSENCESNNLRIKKALNQDIIRQIARKDR